MNRFLRLTFTSILFAFGALALPASAQETMGEVFICNFNDGQDMDDLMNAKDYYLRQSEKAGTPTPPAFVWTPLKMTGGDIDYLWFNYYQNASDYGETADAWAASSDIAAVIERFDQVSTCRSALFTQEPIYAGRTPLDTEASYVQSSACKFRGTPTPGDMTDLRNHINSYLSEAGTHDSFALVERSPVTSSSNTPDIRFVGFHNNAAEWAERFGSFNNEAGQSLLRHFQAVVECTQSHWTSTNMVPIPDQ